MSVREVWEKALGKMGQGFLLASDSVAFMIDNTVGKKKVSWEVPERA